MKDLRETVNFKIINKAFRIKHSNIIEMLKELKKIISYCKAVIKNKNIRRKRVINFRIMNGQIIKTQNNKFMRKSRLNKTRMLKLNP